MVHYHFNLYFKVISPRPSPANPTSNFEVQDDVLRVLCNDLQKVLEETANASATEFFKLPHLVSLGCNP